MEEKIFLSRVTARLLLSKSRVSSTCEISWAVPPPLRAHDQRQSTMSGRGTAKMARLALVAIILSKPSLAMLCDSFVLAISALLVWAARFRESATTDVQAEIQRISGSPVTNRQLFRENGIFLIGIKNSEQMLERGKP